MTLRGAVEASTQTIEALLRIFLSGSLTVETEGVG